jgi:hypothetical protein
MDNKRRLRRSPEPLRRAFQKGASSGPLPAQNSVKVDITIAERITQPCEERVVLRSSPEFADVPEGRTIIVYTLSEIAVEKVVALSDAARTEPRDLYDLWYLTSEGEVDLLLLQNRIRAKLQFRNRPFVLIQDAIGAKESRLRTWRGITDGHDYQKRLATICGGPLDP